MNNFTGRLGASNNKPGNIQLGSGTDDPAFDGDVFQEDAFQASSPDVFTAELGTFESYPDNVVLGYGATFGGTTYNRTTADSLSSISDSLSRVSSLVRTSADSLSSISETATRNVVNFIRTVTDSVSVISESVIRSSSSYIRTVNDAITSITESVSATGATLFRSVEDNLSSLSESVSRNTASFIRTVDDTINSIIENIVRSAISYTRSVADSISSISESVIRGIVLPRAISDSIGSITESISRGAQTFIRSIADAITSITESIFNEGGFLPFVPVPRDHLRKSLKLEIFTLRPRTPDIIVAAQKLIYNDTYGGSPSYGGTGNQLGGQGGDCPDCLPPCDDLVGCGGLYFNPPIEWNFRVKWVAPTSDRTLSSQFILTKKSDQFGGGPSSYAGVLLENTSSSTPNMYAYPLVAGVQGDAWFGNRDINRNGLLVSDDIDGKDVQIRCRIDSDNLFMFQAYVIGEGVPEWIEQYPADGQLPFAKQDIDWFWTYQESNDHDQQIIVDDIRVIQGYPNANPLDDFEDRSLSQGWGSSASGFIWDSPGGTDQDFFVAAGVGAYQNNFITGRSSAIATDMLQGAGPAAQGIPLQYIAPSQTCVTYCSHCDAYSTTAYPFYIGIGSSSPGVIHDGGTCAGCVETFPTPSGCAHGEDEHLSKMLFTLSAEDRSKISQGDGLLHFSGWAEWLNTAPTSVQIKIYGNVTDPSNSGVWVDTKPDWWDDGALMATYTFIKNDIPSSNPTYYILADTGSPETLSALLMSTNTMRVEIQDVSTYYQLTLIAEDHGYPRFWAPGYTTAVCDPNYLDSQIYVNIQAIDSGSGYYVLPHGGNIDFVTFDDLPAIAGQHYTLSGNNIVPSSTLLSSTIVRARFLPNV